MKFKRKSNIELLRVVSMLFIVIGHSLCHSGIGSQTNIINGGFNLQQVEIQYLSILTSTAVNCYVLISGYFLIDSTSFRWSKIFSLWIETFFYSILSYVLLIIFSDSTSFSIKDFVKSSMPIMFNAQNNCYWFIAQYLALYMLYPFINCLLKNIDKEQHQTLIFILLLFLSIYASVYFANNGFSISWFILLYIIGAYIKKYNLPSIYRISSISFYVFLPVPVLVVGSFYDLGILPLSGRYNNLYVLLMSIILFLSFVKMKNFTGKSEKYILAISPHTLGVYLIHDNHYVRKYLWGGIEQIGGINCCIIYLLIFCCLIFIVCVFIDSIRNRVFAFMKIDTICSKIDKVLTK